jgi:hypothetical protein
MHDAGPKTELSHASLNSTKTYYILSESDELTVALFAAEQRALDNAIAEFNTQMDACTKK